MRIKDLTRRFFAGAMAAALIGVMIPAGIVKAATVPAAPNAEAQISIGKKITATTPDIFPTFTSIDFKLEAVKAILNDDDMDALTKTTMPMPTGAAAGVATLSLPSGSFMKTTDKLSESFSDLMKITYTQAGAYMYELSETGSTPANIAGIDYDPTHYYVVVYVTNVIDETTKIPTGAVTVKNITAWNKAGGKEPQWDDLTITDNGDVAAADPDGNRPTDAMSKVGISEEDTPNLLEYPFLNDFSTTDLKVTKKVTGDLGDKTKHFAITTTVTGVEKGKDYTITYTQDGADSDDLSDGTTHPKTIKSSAEGVLTCALQLKHGESYTIEDLPSSATFVTTEPANNHTSSILVNDGLFSSANTSAKEDVKNTEKNKDITSATAGTPLKVYTNDAATTKAETETVLVTNDRVSPTLTGVIMQILPFIAIVAIAIIGFIAFFTGRKEKNTTEGRY